MPRTVGDGRDGIRAFFAVALDEVARAAVVALCEDLRAAPGGDRVRWVRPEGLHVTLCFLGDVEPEAIPGLLREVAPQVAPLAPFRLSLGGLHGFPSPHRARVVALSLSPEAPLAELAAAVARGAAAAGLALEDRPYRAHLTLGRTRGGRIPDSVFEAGGVTAPVTPARETFDVTEAVLFQSRLQRSGARYIPLERIPLTGSMEK